MSRIIHMLAFPGAQLLDVTGPFQVFATANDHAAEAGLPLPYTLSVLAESGGVVPTSSGLGLAVLPFEAAGDATDTLIVPGGDGVYPACSDPRLVAWIESRAAQSARVASVCSGAFLLATAGLLDGRRAVTHWRRCAEFARRFPQIRVEADPIYIQDGKFWTSAGITAGIDLALALVAADLGHAPALAVARQLVMFLKRPGGQSQFSAALALQQADQRFEQLHAYIAGHLADELSVPVLAAEAGMSERSFLRRYRAATGLTPARAVERMRMEAARRMLEARQPVKRVAARCGFGSEETMRRSFLRLLGTSPQGYRDRFAAGPG